LPSVSIETVLVAVSGFGDSMIPPHPKTVRVAVTNAELRVTLALRSMKSQKAILMPGRRTNTMQLVAMVFTRQIVQKAKACSRSLLVLCIGGLALE